MYAPRVSQAVFAVLALGFFVGVSRRRDQARQAHEEFLATLTHELRTPLNAVLGWAQILSEHRDEPVIRDRALEVMDRNARGVIANLTLLDGRRSS